MNERLRIGFIGGGLSSAIGYSHFVASRLDGCFDIVAGCFSRDQECNRSSGLAYGVSPSRIYNEWQDFLQYERQLVDAVVVLTPTPSHHSIVTTALRLGYRVICEKALAVSVEECADIALTVNSLDGYLAVTYNYSGYPMIREVKRLISEGELGTVQQIRIDMPQEGFIRSDLIPQSWRLNDSSIPMVSLDLGVHVHHLIHFVTGGLRPLEVIGEKATYGLYKGLVDNVYVFARLERDIRVQAWWGKTALGHRNGLKLDVYGSNASVQWRQTNPEVLLVSNENGRSYLQDRGSIDSRTSREQRYNRFKPGHPSGFIEAFANLYADIAESIRDKNNGKKTSNGFIYGAVESHEGMMFLDSVARSCQSRSWEEVGIFSISSP
jgi:predicted dehydrogenase